MVTENFASPNGAVLGARHVYEPPAELRLNQWALTGDWAMQREAVVLNVGEGTIAYRFHARDVNVVMGPSERDTPVRFVVRLDGRAPGAAHGLDVDEQGEGTVAEPRLHQLIRPMLYDAYHTIVNADRLEGTERIYTVVGLSAAYLLGRIRTLVGNQERVPSAA